MSNQKRVPHNPGLPAAITLCTLASVTATAGSEQSGTISKYGTAPWLVERYPIFYFRAEASETDPGVVLVVLDKLVLVQHASISLVKFVGEIPMEQRDHWLDACLDKVVDEFDVELKALLIHGVVSSSKRNDA